MTVDPRLVQRVGRSFNDAFGGAPDAAAAAPGRVNLIGEHTDYNDGFVLPCAIDRHTIALARRTPGSRVRVVAADYGDRQDAFDLSEALTSPGDLPWMTYVRGVVGLLHSDRPLGGVDIAIGGDIPSGAGLSSSASLEVALGVVLDDLFDLGLTGPAVARLGQRAENEVVGCACGIMDQLSSAEGRAGHAVLIDCRSLSVTPQPMPDDKRLLAIHSGVVRGLVASAYNERRRQCEAAAAFFGAPALRDVSLERLMDGRSGLDPVVFRRARHVVTENLRTLEFASALAAGATGALSPLMAESHRSMRLDFEITTPAIDRLVEIVSEVLGESGGVRMTGGGFGGCVVALAPEAAVDEVVRAVGGRYATPDGKPAAIFSLAPSAGAAPIDPSAAARAA